MATGVALSDDRVLLRQSAVQADGEVDDGVASRIGDVEIRIVGGDGHGNRVHSAGRDGGHSVRNAPDWESTA